MRDIALAGFFYLAGLGMAHALPPEVEFLSVKVSKAQVHKFPSLKSEVLWVMWKFAPVEILSYRGDWVRIQDYEGDEGWMSRELLSEVPTVTVKIREGRVRKDPGANHAVVWILDRGYSLRVFASKGEWVEVSDLQEVSGWIHQSAVWGAPPLETPRP